MVSEAISHETPVKIASVELISSLGFGGVANNLAIKCGYDGFLHNGRLITSSVDYDNQLRGYKRLAFFLDKLIDFINAKEIDRVLFCSQSHQRSGINTTVLVRQVLKFLTKKDSLPNTNHWQIISQDRVSFVYGLQAAKSLLYEHKANKVLILSADSFLFPQTLNAFLHPPYRAGVPHKPRILEDDNSDGFIPGEAAGAILVTRPKTNTETGVFCTGTGIAEESVLIGDGGVFKAEGLTKAIKATVQQANKAFSDCHYRISSASGEEYFFKETALVQAKLLSQKIDEQPLLLPASHIGEVGAVIGFFMLLMAQEKLQHNRQSLNIIGHLSNDDALRGAFMLQNTLGESHGK